MPLYYSTAKPSNNNKNSITRTAKDFGLRDFLLLKNIINPIRYPQFSTSINGGPKGGEPVLDKPVGNVPRQEELEILGVPRYESAVMINHYKDTDPAAPVYFDIENIPAVPIFPTSPMGSSNYLEEDITKYGLLAKTESKSYRKLATIKNLYVDATKQIDMADFISLQPIQTAQQLTGYLDEYGSLNLGEGGLNTRTANIIGSVLNGQGLGLAKGGIVTNFDIRSTLAGRVLSVAGFLKDTKLGTIGAQQLVLALGNNAIYNAQQKFLGAVDVEDNINSLLLTGKLVGIKPNFQITVRKTTAGKILNTAQNILGFNLPRSFIDNDGSIFFTESGEISNTSRSNNLLDYTGKGQRKALETQIKANLLGLSRHDDPTLSPFRSGYSQAYAKAKDGDDYANNFLVKGQQPKLYAFEESPGSGVVFPFVQGLKENGDAISQISADREEMVKNSGFESYDPSCDKTYYNVPLDLQFRTNFSWKSENDAALNTISDGFVDTESQVFQGEKKSLLAKTQKLFNSTRFKNIVSAKFNREGVLKSQIQTAVAPIAAGGEKYWISRGSNVLSSKNFYEDGTIKTTTTVNSNDDIFCRTWTPQYRYDRVNRLIRHAGLNENNNDDDVIGRNIYNIGSIKNGGLRFNTEGSVLGKNGFVKIGPYKDDKLTRSDINVKQYMFSIENLAWVGAPATNLPPEEQGPGDLLTGKFGRIMWFPPYDINVTESSSVQVETTNFIGRGEPIYTYNNTERTGSLNFKIIVDHSMAMNAFIDTNVSEDYIRSFLAGCTPVDGYWTDILSKIEVSERGDSKATFEEIPTPVEEEKRVVEPISLPSDITIYFKNDRTDVDKTYEASPEGSAGVGNYDSNILEYRYAQVAVPGGAPTFKCVKTTPYTRSWNDDKSFGLNRKFVSIEDKIYTGWIDPAFELELIEYFSRDIFQFKQIDIKVSGAASKQGCKEQNEILAKQRASAARIWIENICSSIPNRNFRYAENVNLGEVGPDFGFSVLQYEKGPKEQRYALIEFSINEEESQKLEPEAKKKTEINEKKVKVTTTTTIARSIKKKFYREADYFQELKKNDQFIFEKIKEKIKYFHPSFHSITPEGLNSRLTFLLQCTRQGPTITGSNPRNLSFGPPPVCILRIGDFYNTKIMMDNVQFDYEPLVWDLNPEGIGVQPMIANVTISFKFLGGSSLQSPINKLQNAVSFNFFANTQVYDPRSDSVSIRKDEAGNIQTRETFGTEKMDKPLIENDYGLNLGLDITKKSMVLEEEVSTETTTEEMIMTQQDKASVALDNLLPPGVPLTSETNTVITTASTATTVTTTTSNDISDIKFGYIDFSKWANSENRTLAVICNFNALKKDAEGYYNFEELLKYETEVVNKGLKFVLTKQADPSFVRELKVTTCAKSDAESENRFTCFSKAYSIGFYFGDIYESNADTPKIYLPDDNYVMSIWLDGKRIQSVNFGDYKEDSLGRQKFTWWF